MSREQLRPDVLVALAETVATAEHPIRVGMTEEGIAYAQAVHEMVHRYELDPDTVVLISQSAGGAIEALAFLDRGMPVEYIVAMGGAA